MAYVHQLYPYTFSQPIDTHVIASPITLSSLLSSVLHLQVQQISFLLHSNVLVEQANQIELSTERTFREFEACQSEAEALHEKLVQIENEKDRERRLTKQRE